MPAPKAHTGKAGGITASGNVRIPLACFALALGMSACAPPATDASPVEQAEAAVSNGVFGDAEVTSAVMGYWSRSCALCHAVGEGGAPRVGDAEAWRPRIARGEAQLLAHTIEGYNDMPPLGYCMACEHDDFRALIKFMVGPQ